MEPLVRNIIAVRLLGVFMLFITFVLFSMLIEDRFPFMSGLIHEILDWIFRIGFGTFMALVFVLMAVFSILAIVDPVQFMELMGGNGG